MGRWVKYVPQKWEQRSGKENWQRKAPVGGSYRGSSHQEPAQVCGGPGSSRLVETHFEGWPWQTQSRPGFQHVSPRPGG